MHGQFPRKLEYDLDTIYGFQRFFNAYIGKEHFNATAEAFRAKTFVYGTVTGGSAIGRWGNLAKKALGQEVYDPGRRANAALSNADRQLMDYYCGNDKAHIYTLRVPIIAEYVHRGMWFHGNYNKDIPGYTAYKETHCSDPNSRQHEPWAFPVRGDESSALYKHRDSKTNNLIGMTGSQEISRLVRAGVKHFGGKLIFEGSNVSYWDVFSNASTVFKSDTMLEARGLFPNFRPGHSTAEYGNGMIIFHWKGVERIPSHWMFETSWKFNLTANTIEPRKSDDKDMSDLWKNFTASCKDDKLAAQVGVKFEDAMMQAYAKSKSKSPERL